MTLDGVTTTEAASSVDPTISGGNGHDVLQISMSLVRAAISILFDGREGVDRSAVPRRHGWVVTGSGAGTVAGVYFANVEELVGASDTEDTFIVQAGGSISSVDGGDGFDTLLVGANVAPRPSPARTPERSRDGT